MPLTADDTTAIQKIITDALAPHATQVQANQDALGEINLAIKAVTDSQTEMVETVSKITDANATDPKTAKTNAGKTDESTPTPLTAEDVATLINKSHDDRDATATASRDQQAATDAYLKAHAPRLVGNKLAESQMSRATTDEERAAALEWIKELIVATGLKVPDLAAVDSQTEGGAAASAESIEAQEQTRIEEITSRPTTRL